MNVLILGGGGREHALAWKIAQSPLIGRLIAAPGNAGIAQIAETHALDVLSAPAVVAFCRHEKVDFVVIGPEAPLAAGVSDALVAAGIACFGPSRAAARLETSKTFAKEICAACGAPTAAWASFDRADAAKIHIMASGAPIVVKADGLAAGKGVVVAQTVGQALAAVDDVFAGRTAKPAAGEGARVVIEEAMPGVEASLFVLTDGDAILSLGAAQDAKRAHDGDKGPNTGGMGAFCPTAAAGPAVERAALERIVRPMLREMASRGTPYRGVFYAGLMIAPGPDGAPAPRLVEVNARFGDPETQALMRRLDGDLLPALLACAEPVGVARGRGGRRLEAAGLSSRERAVVGVTLAAKGYPGDYAKGEPIRGIDAVAGVPGAVVFHAGTRAEGGEVVSNGGRVLTVTAEGENLAEARRRAYAAVDEIRWPGGFARRDIAEAAVREAEAARAAAEEAARREAAAIAAEKQSRERSASERPASQNASSQNASSENISSEKMSSGNTPSDDDSTQS